MNRDQEVLSAMINNRITTDIIKKYMLMIELDWEFERLLAEQIYKLLKEIHTISGVPSQFEHIDRHYYKAAIELLEKEGKVKTYGSVVQLVPTLEDRKKLLVERINNGKLDLIENLESTLDYYDRGDNL